jgi:hypothetical protein
MSIFPRLRHVQKRGDFFNLIHSCHFLRAYRVYLSLFAPKIFCLYNRPVDIDFEQIERICTALEGLSDKKSDTQLPLELSKSKEFSSEYRKIGLEVFFGRKKVSKYFPDLRKGFFTQQGLEQRSHPEVSLYHSNFFTPEDSILEVGSGLGFDTIHLARHGKSVTSLEVDPIHAAFARKNLTLCSCENAQVLEVSYEDYIEGNSFEKFTALWADPMRRSHDGVRTKLQEEFSPPLSLLTNNTVKKSVIKINPTNKNSFPNWNSQWVGYQKECKEKLLIRSLDTPDHSLIPTVHVIESNTDAFCSRSLDQEVIFIETLPEPPFVLLEPHAALLAADVSEQFFAQHKALNLPKPGKLAITTLDAFHLNEPSYKGLVEAFIIDSVKPFRLTDLKQILNERNWDNRTELKKANFQEEPESFRGQLGLTARGVTEDTPPGVVFFTRLYEKKIMFLGKRIVA